jgi:hypothetical protein
LINQKLLARNLLHSTLNLELKALQLLQHDSIPVDIATVLAPQCPNNSQAVT